LKADQYSNYGGIDVLKVSLTPKARYPRWAGAGGGRGGKHQSNRFQGPQGYMKDFVPLKFPATIGGDFAGVVQRNSRGRFAFKVAAKVYGSRIILNGGSGSFAEFVAAKYSKRSPRAQDN